ncbi:uncharacterized protein KY384_006464 [Bacidia gigantensis]|uniref:uncharacterized protein n=1 Tax=Bacidia gigantensis TaxID=2732470 RepID=UPI001D039AC3|nr:uncharacterized protein KY384_006464 [Bacidia gigantensis]KAG8528776.1 hypothetical protein KY384_006464 [Bacidia gigantensis]
MQPRFAAGRPALVSPVHNIFTTASPDHLSPPHERPQSHRRSNSRNSLALHLVLNSQLNKRMSQYGNQQSYGQPQESFAPQDQSYGGQADQAQDPSQYGQYDQQDQSQYGQQDPSQNQGDEYQQDGAQDPYQQDGQGDSQQYQQHNQGQLNQPNGSQPQSNGYGNGQSPQQTRKQPSQNQQFNQGAGAEGQGHVQQRNNQVQPSKQKPGQQQPQGQQKPASYGTGRNYHPTHHNALYHMSQTANNGFTKDHMDSFLHLGTYALGALANQHSLAPDAMHPETEGLQQQRH